MTGPEGSTLHSQGSLVYNRGFLFAVNAGSNTVTLFGARGTHLELLETVPSGGLFSNSIAVHPHSNDIYVLNAGGDGMVKGLRLITRGRSFGLIPIEDASR